MIYVLIVLFAIAVVWSGLALFKKMAILDRPGPDVPPRDRVPSVQWVFLVLGFFLAIAIFFPQYYVEPQFLGFLIWIGVLFWINYIDAFKSISPILRLISQGLAWAIAFFVAGVWFHEIALPTWWIWVLPTVFAVAVTIIWFIGFMNAINWFDWVYWLASGVSSIGYALILLLINFVVLPHYPSISPENLNTLQIASTIASVCLIFSILYTIVEYKPLGLLRDVGIIFYGFSLAYLTLLWWAKVGAILVVLSLVIFDAIWVFVNRVFVLKKNPLKGDYTHLHYRLLALWWNRNEVRAFIWGWSVVLLILMLLQEVESFNKIVIFVMMCVLFFWIHIYLYWIKKLPMEYKVKK